MKSHVAFGLVVLVGLAMAAAVPAPEVTEKTSPTTVNPSSLSAKKPEVTEKTSPTTGSRSPLSSMKPEVTVKTSATTGSRSPRAAKEAEVAEKTSAPTGSRPSRAAKEAEVAEKTSAPTGSRPSRAAKEPEVAEKTSAPTGSRSPRAAKEPEVAEKTSAPTGSRSPRAAKEPEVAEKTSAPTGSRSPRAAKEPEVAEKTSAPTGSRSPRAAKEPEVAEKTSAPTGSRSSRAAKEPEVAEKTSAPTGSRPSRAAKEPEVAEKTSAPTGSRPSRAAKEAEVAEKTSAPTGSRPSRAAKEPEVVETTSPTTGSPSAPPSKKPEVAEKTSPTGSPSQRAPRRPEVTETAAPIEVEGADEPKQADRTKKSASTTFCVEIRPGPSEAPVKVCENPPPPAVPHETHEQAPPPPPTYLHEPEVPVYIVPSYAQPEVLLPNDPCPPQGLPYHQSVNPFPHFFHHSPQRPQIVVPQVPCPPEPCPPTCACANRPHATISLFRSAMAPNDAAHAQIDGTETRSNAETSGLETEAIDAGITGREVGPENGESPMARTFLRDHYGLPLYHGGLFGHRYPHLIRYHPHLIPLGLGRAADGTSGLEDNAQHIMAVNGQPAMEMSQQGRYLVHPYTSPVAGYQSHPVYHSYQSPAIPHSAAHHSIYPGYAVRPHQATAVLDRYSMPIYANHAIVSPGSAHRYRSDQQRPLPIKSDQQQQQKNQEKSWSEDRHATDQQNRSDQSGQLSPSQILNRMRGSDGSTSFDLRPVMQSFPRINEERIGNENGLSVNMNFPRGGQPFMIPGSRTTGIEKKLKSGDCGDDEIGKRDAEKSAGEKDN